MNEPQREGAQCQLDGCLFFSTAKLARELGRLADEAFQKTGLSPSHAVLLYLINLHGRVQQKDAGALLHLTSSTVTRLIEKLVRKGFVKRQQVGKNVCLLATVQGRAQQQEIVTAWNKLHNRYQNILTEQETLQFLNISRKLLEHLTNEEK